MGFERKKIIMVDDDRTNLTVVKNALIDRYDVFTVPSGEKLFGLFEKVAPDLILLDIEMPEMNGYEVIRKLKDSEQTVDIPVIFLSGMIDPESEIEGLNLGAVDYIFKPFSRELLLKRIELHLLLEAQKQELKRYSSNLEGMVLEKTQTVIELQNTVVKTVAELVESRDNITGGHITRTQNYLRILVNLLLKHGIYLKELEQWDIDLFVTSSQLHDVGKISIKDEILLKPGSLTDEEFEIMKNHAAFGRKIIEKIEESTPNNAFLEHAKILAGSHHERWDGNGYPLGLKGEDIPLQGRLMAIVDVYDALTNDRPYKKAYTHEEAIGIIEEGTGKHFDPLIGEVFVRYEKDFANADMGGEANPARTSSSAQLNMIIKTVSSIADIRGDGSAVGQAERVRRYLRVFVDALIKHEGYREELSAWDIDVFLMSAQLHDIGKIAVPGHILNKAGELTREEFDDVKRHADIGVKIVLQIKENVDDGNLLQHAEALAGSHHERWDGTGYPKGLKGKSIPLQGRIMAIVDVYDALTSHRPQRSMLNHKEAVSIVRNLSGGQFDPELVDIFLEHEKEFERVGVV